jgi:hypothetical protein
VVAVVGAGAEVPDHYQQEQAVEVEVLEVVAAVEVLYEFFQADLVVQVQPG